MLGHALNPDELVTRFPQQPGFLRIHVRAISRAEAVGGQPADGRRLRDFYIKNDRGETLHALYVAAAEPTRKTAVIVHGYTDNSIRMLNIGYRTNRQPKYNILLPDLHGHGASEGAGDTNGLASTVSTYCNGPQPPTSFFGRNNETVTAGDSTRSAAAVRKWWCTASRWGAATTMMVSGEVEHGIHQQPFIKCFVEDCGYTSVWDEFRGELKA